MAEQRFMIDPSTNRLVNQFNEAATGILDSRGMPYVLAPSHAAAEEIDTHRYIIVPEKLASDDMSPSAICMHGRIHTENARFYTGTDPHRECSHGVNFAGKTYPLTGVEMADGEVKLFARHERDRKTGALALICGK